MCLNVRDPELGLCYLVRQRFVEHSASSVARFLITRKGLSKLKIGEYLGNLQQRFNMDVLGSEDLIGFIIVNNGGIDVKTYQLISAYEQIKNYYYTNVSLNYKMIV